ncbi:hypothetical protein Ga0466249_002220 [Sporomusaceae bacterium BoRhaA]|uniref:hypothetical protein n=1 Tax=Pelorhabdus rhamnosifermentans TaxID=2772457 RepID=UPI001FE91FC7|nr:hypothetical protein [Pelorhabdus rhamnosifermentans]MBU2701109.1 hypothetical protein [Pelorhabdus rhamnosifermentans]
MNTNTITIVGRVVVDLLKNAGINYLKGMRLLSLDGYRTTTMKKMALNITKRK